MNLMWRAKAIETRRGAVAMSLSFLTLSAALPTEAPTE